MKALLLISLCLLPACQSPQERAERENMRNVDQFIKHFSDMAQP
jgi:hypothetical protein